MLIVAAQSLLLVVDVQERLVPALHDGAALVQRTAWLVRVAQRLGVPVAASEQYPQGLGPTVAPVRSLLPEAAIAAKVHFSLVRADAFASLPDIDRPQVVIAGAEAHVCVLQTACDVLARGREVFVVADAVASRHDADRMLAIDRLRARGAEIVSCEMVAFEWLERAATPAFREVLQDFLKAGPAGAG